MTWLQRYRLKDSFRNSVWLPAAVSIPAAILAARLAEPVDHLVRWIPPVGIEGTRVVLTALASAMLTFIVFVFSILLLAVQLAKAIHWEWAGQAREPAGRSDLNEHQYGRWEEEPC